MKLPQEILQMNRGQMLVAVIAILAIGYLLVKEFLIVDLCLNRMCPINDYSWVWQTGLIAAACAVAYWLLKTDKKNSKS